MIDHASTESVHKKLKDSAWMPRNGKSSGNGAHGFSLQCDPPTIAIPRFSLRWTNVN